MNSIESKSLYSIDDIVALREYDVDRVKLLKKHIPYQVAGVYLLLLHMLNITKYVDRMKAHMPNHIFWTDQYLINLMFLQGCVRIRTNDPDEWKNRYHEAKTVLETHYDILQRRFDLVSRKDRACRVIECMINRYCSSSEHKSYQQYIDKRVRLLMRLMGQKNENAEVLKILVRSYGMENMRIHSLLVIGVVNICSELLLNAIHDVIPTLDTYDSPKALLNHLTEHMRSAFTAYCSTNQLTDK
jgi:hypothetical protein